MSVQQDWERCPSTHCERWKECRSPGECSGTGWGEVQQLLREIIGDGNGAGRNPQLMIEAAGKVRELLRTLI